MYLGAKFSITRCQAESKSPPSKIHKHGLTDWPFHLAFNERHPCLPLLLSGQTAWTADCDGAKRRSALTVSRNSAGAACYRLGFLSLSFVFHRISFLGFLDILSPLM
ncbi:hypothetical protein MHYP_G00125150 [Metynnis hypsauchen]